ncbi:hypothetical protein DFH08DRAFT_790832 [Mycena albidolilacea]|uniref:Tetratricopeptide SHNi-TPR domain-containing protein n=1 Tax=Mycena albidolilacea TaxID=1033008 RepID=A0AAD6ZAQ6_9AGAR|nr:hypothetical protein DFH08DRAFT_790832 [Mycena albidolilacea]
MADPSAEMSLETAVEHAKRAFALDKYEQAVDYYATALELITKKCGEDAPETADLYFAYGKALLENAISQSSVLGKDQPEDGAEEAQGSSSNGPILSFTGDAEDTEVDLKDIAEEADAGEDGDADADDDAEPEDDFNAAWEVLDLARAIYARQTADDGTDEDVQLKLADTYIALGDVSLETEKFDQAITDYEAGLKLKDSLLPRSSRQIAEAHYKLSMVLDLTSGRLGDAISHAEHALESIECRLELLANPPPPPATGSEPAAPEADPNGKGKGKATTRLVQNDVIASMSAAQREAESKELAGLKEDLAIKVEELKTRPDEPLKNASALAEQALDAELNARGVVGPNGAAGSGAAVVNDLTGIVKKKKKVVPAEASTPTPAEASGSSSPGGTKRKADDEGPGESGVEGKKVRLDDGAAL